MRYRLILSMTLLCAIFTEPLLAAEPAKTTEQLKKLSDKVVVGKVERVKRTSSIFRKIGGRTDYEITVEIEGSGKGKPDKLVYKAFTMDYRAPLSPDAGPQGNTIPKRGKRVRLYLKAVKAEGEKTEYWVLHPNGTEILE